jgi:hypothetical protein
LSSYPKLVIVFFASTKSYFGIPLPLESEQSFISAEIRYLQLKTLIYLWLLTDRVGSRSGAVSNISLNHDFLYQYIIQSTQCKLLVVGTGE